VSSQQGEAYEVRFTGTANAEMRIAPNVTVWEGLQAAGWTMRMGCRRGGCGVCRVRCVVGTVRMAPWASSALGPHDVEAGWILVCRAYAQTDLVLEVGAEARLRPLAGWTWWRGGDGAGGVVPTEGGAVRAKTTGECGKGGA